MNNEITDYEEFANSRDECDSYIAPIIMKDYKERKVGSLDRNILIAKGKLPNRGLAIQNFKTAIYAATGFLAVFGVSGLVEAITRII